MFTTQTMEKIDSSETSKQMTGFEFNELLNKKLSGSGISVSMSENNSEPTPTVEKVEVQIPLGRKK